MRRSMVFLICAILLFNVFIACDGSGSGGSGGNGSPDGSESENGTGENVESENTDNNETENENELPWGGEAAELPILPFE